MEYQNRLAGDSVKYLLLGMLVVSTDFSNLFHQLIFYLY